MNIRSTTLKLFSTTDKSFTSNGDKIIIPTKAKIHKEDNGVTVRYAKKLKDITCEESWDSVVTKLLPVGKDGVIAEST